MDSRVSLWLEWSEAHALIIAELGRRQCLSLTSYVEAEPQMDLLEVTRLLAIIGVHSGHLLRQLWHEAAETGELARCARDLLVRALCARLQYEERAGPRHFEDAFYQWKNELPLNYQGVEESIRATLLQVLPPCDWVPQTADDSILVGLFSQHWPAEEPGRRYRVTSDSAGGLTIEPDRSAHRERIAARSASRSTT